LLFVARLALTVVALLVALRIEPLPPAQAADEKACVNLQGKITEVDPDDLPRLIKQGVKPVDCPKKSPELLQNVPARGSAPLPTPTATAVPAQSGEPLCEPDRGTVSRPEAADVAKIASEGVHPTACGNAGGGNAGGGSSGPELAPQLMSQAEPANIPTGSELPPQVTTQAEPANIANGSVLPPQLTGQAEVANIATVSDPPSQLTIPADSTNSTIQNNGVGLAELSVSLSHEPQPVVAGKALMYTATVKNTGSAAAIGIYVRYTLPMLEITNEPAEFLYVTGPDGFECSLIREPAPAHVNCVSGDINANSTSDIRIALGAPLQGGVMSSSATVDPDNTIIESRNDNNTAFSSATVLGRPDLTVSIGEPLDPAWGPCFLIFCPDEYVVPVTVTNVGESAATGRVRVDYPESVSFTGTEDPCPAGSHVEGGVCATSEAPHPIGGQCDYPHSDFGTDFRAVNCPFESLEAQNGVVFLINLRVAPIENTLTHATITAEVDPPDHVDERREDNNSASRSIP
jgi:hypothetical protein